MKHHLWCNNFNPHNLEYGAEDCKMCIGLREEYPEVHAENEEEIVKKLFPNIVIIRDINEPT